MSVVGGGVIDYTLTDGTTLTFDYSKQREIGGVAPLQGDLLISVTGSNGYVLSAQPRHGQDWPEDCYFVPGRAWNLGDAVGIVASIVPSVSFRVPKAAHLDASIDPYGDDKTQYMGISGVCLNAKGEATAVR